MEKVKSLLDQADKKEYFITDGDVTHIEIRKRNGDDLIKFNLDGDPNEFSMFGKISFSEGDWIKIKYIIKDDKYYNVKEIMATKNTHTEPTDEDKELLEEQLIGYDPQTVKTILMKCSVDLCIKRNELNDKEIFACYERFLEIIK